MKKYEYGGLNSDLIEDLNDLYYRSQNISSDNIEALSEEPFNVTDVKFADVSTVNSVPMYWVNRLVQFFKVNKSETLTKTYNIASVAANATTQTTDDITIHNGMVRFTFVVPAGYDGRQAIATLNFDENRIFLHTSNGSWLENTLLHSMSRKSDCKIGYNVNYNAKDIQIEFLREGASYDIPAFTLEIFFWRYI